MLPQSARAQTPSSLETLRIASAPDEDVLAALWAHQSGLCRRYGIDVLVQAMNSGSAVAAAVAGGAIEIGKSSLVSLISAHVRGIPFVLVAPAGIYNAKAPTIGLLVNKGSNLRTARDLNGKIFSVPSLNDQYSIALKMWMDQHGGDSQSLKFVELPNAAVPQAIVDGRIDAAALGNPLLAEAVNSGKVQMIARPDDAIAQKYIQAAYFCTTDFASKNRDLVNRFARVIADSATYCNAHHDATIAVLSEFTKVPPQLIAQMTRVEMGVTLDPKLIQPVIDGAARYKAIAGAFDARDMIAPQVAR